MKEKFLNELSDSIDRRKPEKEIESLCRQAIRSDIQIRNPQKEKIEALSDLIERIDIPIVEARRDIVVVPQERSSTGFLSYSDAANAVGVMACAAIGYVCVKLWGLPFWGGILGAAGGIMCSRFIRKVGEDKAKQDTSVQPGMPEVVYRPASEIAESVDTIVRCFERLLEKEVPTTDHPLENGVAPGTDYPLETPPYIMALRWLYDDLRRNKNPEDTEDLTFVLNKCGYDLIEYSPENDDMFSVSIANVLQPTTTVKALVNKQTGDCVIEGRVVFPLHD